MIENKSKVLALKYRPAAWEQVIGNEVIVTAITNSIRSSMIPNAWLLTGIRGSGKTTLARLISRSLNCENGIDNLCKDKFCKNCEEITNSNSLSTLEIDGATATGIDSVRELKEQALYRPADAKYKIFLIDEAHQLSRAAFAGLLKILESPPSWVRFILCSTQIEKFPVTILSRCQRYTLSRVRLQVLLNFLKEIVEKEKGLVSEDALKLVCKLSEGSTRDALSLTERAILEGRITKKKLDLDKALKIFGSFNKSYLIELFKSVFEGKEEDSLKKYKMISDLGTDPKIFLSEWLEILYLMKNIKIFGNNEISFSLSDNQTKEIEQLSNQVDVETLIMFWGFTIKTLEELKFVSNQNLSIEMFLIRLIHLKRIPKLEELLKNVELAQDKTGSKEIKTLSNIKNQIKEDVIKETNQSTDQIKNVIQEKKEILDNDKTFKLLNESKNSTETVSNFDNLISLCLKHKEMQLKYDLEKNVSLLKFSNGQIEFSFNENIDKNFIKNLSKKLFIWTGKRWIITLSKEKGQPTHQKIKLEKKQTQLDEATKTNAYKKVLEAFSDAKLITVEENEDKE